MKRYLLFGFDTYYPSGGWNDFLADFDTTEEAIEYALTMRRDWFHVIDGTTGQIAKEVARK